MSVQSTEASQSHLDAAADAHAGHLRVKLGGQAHLQAACAAPLAELPAADREAHCKEGLQDLAGNCMCNTWQEMSTCNLGIERTPFVYCTSGIHSPGHLHDEDSCRQYRHRYRQRLTCVPSTLILRWTAQKPCCLAAQGLLTVPVSPTVTGTVIQRHHVMRCDARASPRERTASEFA